MLGPVTAQLAELVDALTTKGPAEVRALVPGDGSYAEIIAGVALGQVTSPLAPERLAWVLTGIGFRESSLGTAADLVQGTGDFCARVVRPHHRTGRHRIIDRAEDLPAGWSLPRDDHGAALPGPWAIPLDGLGFGRGPWQADYDAHPEVVDQVDAAGVPLWRNTRWACQQAALRFLADLATLGQERMALAAYNCGVGGVRRALNAGVNVDTFTTGSKGSRVGDYSRWILNHIASWTGGAPVAA